MSNIQPINYWSLRGVLEFYRKQAAATGRSTEETRYKNVLTDVDANSRNNKKLNEIARQNLGAGDLSRIRSLTGNPFYSQTKTGIQMDGVTGKQEEVIAYAEIIARAKKVNRETLDINNNYYSDQVKTLQLALNLYGSNLAVDGIIGNHTTAALKRFKSEPGTAISNLVAKFKLAMGIQAKSAGLVVTSPPPVVKPIVILETTKLTSNKKIDISWKKDTSVTKYDVVIKNELNHEVEKYNNLSASTYSDGMKTTNTYTTQGTYYVWVRAHKGAVVGNWQSKAITIPTAPTTAPKPSPSARPSTRPSPRPSAKPNNNTAVKREEAEKIRLMPYRNGASITNVGSGCVEIAWDKNPEIKEHILTLDRKVIGFETSVYGDRCKINVTGLKPGRHELRLYSAKDGRPVSFPLTFNITIQAPKPAKAKIQNRELAAARAELEKWKQVDLSNPTTWSGVGINTDWTARQVSEEKVKRIQALEETIRKGGN